LVYKNLIMRNLVLKKTLSEKECFYSI